MYKRYERKEDVQGQGDPTPPVGTGMWELGLPGLVETWTLVTKKAEVGTFKTLQTLPYPQNIHERGNMHPTQLSSIITFPRPQTIPFPGEFLVPSCLVAWHTLLFQRPSSWTPPPQPTKGIIALPVSESSDPGPLGKRAVLFHWPQASCPQFSTPLGNWPFVVIHDSFYFQKDGAGKWGAPWGM